MWRAFRVTIGLMMTVCGPVLAQQTSKNDLTIRYDHSRWKLIKRISAKFDPLPVPPAVLLLESLKPTGRGGLGQAQNDVELLIGYGGDIHFFDYIKNGVKPPDYNGTRFYTDDYLEIRDVTNDGVPEVLFHSGFEGASDATTLEHVLFYDKLGGSLVDVAPETFYNSGTHGLRWLNLAGQTFAVVADRNWPAATAPDAQCHYCPSPFKYDVYLWGLRKGWATFEVYRHLYGKKAYSEARQALEGDWTFIQSGLNH